VFADPGTARSKNPPLPGVLLCWVCRNSEYLDLTEDRRKLTPA